VRIAAFQPRCSNAARHTSNSAVSTNSTMACPITHASGQTPNFNHPGSLTIKSVAVLNECRCHSIGTSLVGPRHPDRPAQARKDRIDDRIDMHLVRISCGPDGR